MLEVEDSEQDSPIKPTRASGSFQQVSSQSMSLSGQR
jgi:hypothetical protein